MRGFSFFVVFEQGEKFIPYEDTSDKGVKNEYNPKIIRFDIWIKRVNNAANAAKMQKIAFPAVANVGSIYEGTAKMPDFYEDTSNKG